LKQHYLYVNAKQMVRNWGRYNFDRTFYH